MSTIIKNNNALAEQVKQWKSKGETIGFVPTMGALHDGHKSLIEKAKNDCDRVVVSIFVNPIQFAPTEDFDKYPRQLESDAEICKKIGVDLIFAPDENEMYPDGRKNITTVVPPETFQNKLCGKSREGHFNGVATVVLKLFDIVAPDKAYFGQKDAQQLLIIKKMAKDLNLPVEVIACPIVRDEDGLALSSRNAYLSDEDRLKAVTVSKVLKKIEQEYILGEKLGIRLIESSLNLLHPDVKIEYLEFVDANTMDKVEILKPDTLVAIAVKVSDVRLIDNILIK